MEEKIYNRSVTKEAMSGRVVEKKQIDRHFKRDDLEEFFLPYKQPTFELPKVPADDLLKLLIRQPSTKNSTIKFHEHDSLLENKPDQDLNEEEKKEAWAAYDVEVQQKQNRMVAVQNSLNNSNLSNIPLVSSFSNFFSYIKVNNNFLCLAELAFERSDGKH
jgi:hypothetical protein